MVSQGQLRPHGQMTTHDAANRNYALCRNTAPTLWHRPLNRHQPPRCRPRLGAEECCRHRRQDGRPTTAVSPPFTQQPFPHPSPSSRFPHPSPNSRFPTLHPTAVSPTLHPTAVSPPFTQQRRQEPQCHMLPASRERQQCPCKRRT